jgi:multidrug resistance efflux pump
MRNAFAFALLALFVSVAVVAPVARAQRIAPADLESDPANAFIKAINSVRVPSEVQGKITKMKVGEGDYIEQGDVVAVIDDSQAALTLELRLAEETEARLNAENDVNLRDAKNSEQTAIAEYKSYAKLESEGATPFWEMEKKRLEADRATLRIELAELQQNVAQSQHAAKKFERQLAELEVARRQVAAPFAGFVENRVAQLGEWVQPGSPIVHLVQLDQLRVEGYLNGFAQPGRVAPGAPAVVEVFVAQDKRHRLEGKLGFVSSEMDVNQRYRVWVDIPNVRQAGSESDWLIKPGMRATIQLKPQGNLATR